MIKQYLVTVHDVGNITHKAENVHTILTSTDHISPRERVDVVDVTNAPSLAAWRTTSQRQASNV